MVYFYAAPVVDFYSAVDNFGECPVYFPDRKVLCVKREPKKLNNSIKASQGLQH